MRALPSLLLLLSAAAAAGPDEANRMRPDHAPTPYTAEQIRKASGEGRTDVFRIESAGQKPWTYTLKFLKGDREAAEVESFNPADDGTVTSRSKDRQMWVDFQAHASFLELDTKITEETNEVPAGKFDCWLYTVLKRDAGATVRMWFAKKRPGPPVRMTTEEKGKVVFAMTLKEHKDGAKPEEEKAPEEKDKGKPGG
jgi:hypothetical protein